MRRYRLTDKEWEVLEDLGIVLFVSNHFYRSILISTCNYVRLRPILPRKCPQRSSRRFPSPSRHSKNFSLHGRSYHIRRFQDRRGFSDMWTSASVGPPNTIRSSTTRTHTLLQCVCIPFHLSFIGIISNCSHRPEPARSIELDS